MQVKVNHVAQTQIEDKLTHTQSAAPGTIPL